MRMQGYCDDYKWTILKRTLPEVKCLHPTSSRREMCMSSVSNVIYHKGQGSRRDKIGPVTKINEIWQYCMYMSSVTENDSF